MTVVPGQKGTAGVEEVPDPDARDASLLVQGMALGVCGTDHEIAEGAYGTPPSGEERLIIGHESLGEVLEAPAGSGFAPGDLVAGIVRRPDPEPCPACAAGEWDMCRTDSFAERRRHWEQAAQALATADPGWLRGLITRRVPLTSWTEALDRHPEDIKVVVDLTA